VRVERQPAFVLHARPYRETSLLLECLSRDYGRIGLVARGVRRERSRWPRGLLQPLVPLALGWSGRGEIATLIDAEAAGTPLQFAGEALFCTMYLNELVLRLIARYDPHGEIFALYAATLARLAERDDPAWTLRRFERDLLAELGYGLLLDAEADSGEPLVPEADYVYLPEHGPVPFAGQPRALRLRGAALLALARDERPGLADLVALRRLMRALIGHQLGGGQLKAWSLLAGLPGPAAPDEV